LKKFFSAIKKGAVKSLFLTKCIFLSLCLLRWPEEFIQRLAKDFADTDAKIDGRIIIPFFNGVDRLPGNSYLVGKFLLGIVQCCPG
jgi:hypothetical protein